MKITKSEGNGTKGGSVTTGAPTTASDGSVHHPDLVSKSLTANNIEDGGNHPNPEVRVRRRRQTKQYKLSILKQVEKLKGTSAVGELLRREGLYSASIVKWRKQRDEGSLGQQRGRRARPAEFIEMEKLRKENGKLRNKIQQYVLVIEAQKKMSEILGVCQDNVPRMPKMDEDE